MDKGVPCFEQNLWYNNNKDKQNKTVQVFLRYILVQLAELFWNTLFTHARLYEDI